MPQISTVPANSFPLPSLPLCESFGVCPKQHVAGQRVVLNWPLLCKEFTLRSGRPDPGLRALLDMVLTSDFYIDDILEPKLGDHRTEVILGNVRKKAPGDPRFTRISVAGRLPRGADDEKSIFTLFVHKNGSCPFSKWSKDGTISKCTFKANRNWRYVDHVRTHLGHRPFSCPGDIDCAICSDRYN